MNDTKNKIINWEKVFSYSDSFKNNSPCKWQFIEEFFDKEFYEKLYETFPKDDDTWELISTWDKNSLRKLWSDDTDGSDPSDIVDPNFSESWNEFHHYLFSDEFIQNIQKFSNIPVGRLKHFSMKISREGDYQSPHIHNVGPSTLIFMIYFTKNWKKGDPGGTYVTPEEDESKIIFEADNLDNTAVVFQDGPHSGHGVRPLKEGVERHAIQIYLEGWSAETGWSCDPIVRELREI